MNPDQTTESIIKTMAATAGVLPHRQSMIVHALAGGDEKLNQVIVTNPELFTSVILTSQLVQSLIMLALDFDGDEVSEEARDAAAADLTSLILQGIEFIDRFIPQCN